MCLWWSGGDVEWIREERKNEAEKQAASFAGTWNFKRGHLKRSSRQGVPSPVNCIATVDGHIVLTSWQHCLSGCLFGRLHRMDMDDGTLSQADFSGLYKNISGLFSHILYFKKKNSHILFPPF
jgi:hypothetical protein